MVENAGASVPRWTVHLDTKSRLSMNSDSLEVVSRNKLMDSLRVGVAALGLREKLFSRM